ncbi:MAG: hypothetical protein WCX29_00930 [Candidatus Peribacteraceae bacterium]
MRIFASVLACFALIACTAVPSDTPTPDDTDVDAELPQEEEFTDDDSALRETPNVTYAGTVRPAGISIYQQGTHRLVLDDGRFVLLESDTVDLNGYVDERVEAYGAVRPTVEAGGMIMRVERVRLDSTTQSEDSEESEPDDEPQQSDSEPESEEEPLEEEEEEEEEEPVLQDDESDETEPPAEQEDSDTDAQLETEIDVSAVTEYDAQQVETMAADTYTADRWTQEYCTMHIGFCIPVHKNWWFKSFGSTSSYLWHVELGTQPVDALGDGVIVVNLVSGSLADIGANDGEVVVQDNAAIGFRAWTNDSHFEIVAPAVLQEPIRFITQRLREHDGE